MIKIDNKEKEIKKFEEELLEMELKLLQEENNPLQKKYKNPYKKFYLTLLLSFIILVIIFIGMKLYAENSILESNKDDDIILRNVVKFSVNEYYRDHKRYPINNKKEIDLILLKNKGYLPYNVEDYHEKYLLDDNYQVVTKKDG